MKRRLSINRGLVCSVLLIPLWGAVVAALWDSPYLDNSRYASALYTQHLMESAEGGASVSFGRASAVAYWKCYPDVATDPYFGISGPLGMLGAREHFERHGRREGRVWPLDESDCMNTDVTN